MGVKENFISLFTGYEEEIINLPERFLLKDFSYMYTSQRTMDRIWNKLRQITEVRAEGRLHQNFWVDLRNMGLAKIDIEDISEFGHIVLNYLDREEDEFKREHFILSGIRQKTFDISNEVYEDYIKKNGELSEFIEKIPAMNYEGRELLKNPEKLLITGFLNVFPFALSRYFGLSDPEQSEIDSLHESGLKSIFPQEAPSSIYYNIAKRLWNIWRAPYRRVNFIKSVILSEYEEKVSDDINQKIPFLILDSYSKILNENLLIEIIKESDNLKIIEEDGNIFIELRSLELPEIPKERKVRRTHKIKKKVISRKRITSVEQLRREEGEEEERPLPEVDPSELQLRIEKQIEKTREHQEIIIKFWEFYTQHEIQALDENNFDLLAEKNDKVLLHEMKTITEKNERSQVIKAIGQLFYYEYFELPPLLKNDNSDIIKVAVFQTKLKEDAHISLMKSLSIHIYWISETGEISGEEESMQFLLDFVKP